MSGEEEFGTQSNVILNPVRVKYVCNAIIDTIIVPYLQI